MLKGYNLHKGEKKAIREKQKKTTAEKYILKWQQKVQKETTVRNQ